MDAHFILKFISQEGHRMQTVTNGSWQEAFHQYRDEILTKIRKGDTEQSIAIGGGEFTQTQWNRALKNIDEQLEDIKEEQAQRLAKNAKEQAEDALAQKAVQRNEAAKVMQAAFGNRSLEESMREVGKTPYSELAKDGEITYNGITFVCDERTNSICLGDVSDPKDTLVIPLENGGSLKVNRNNLDELQRAIGMFSPEDINRILNAIAKDKKAREMQMELEEEKNDPKQIED